MNDITLKDQISFTDSFIVDTEINRKYITSWMWESKFKVYLDHDKRSANMYIQNVPQCAS